MTSISRKMIVAIVAALILVSGMGTYVYASHQTKQLHYSTLNGGVINDDGLFNVYGGGTWFCYADGVDPPNQTTGSVPGLPDLFLSNCDSTINGIYPLGTSPNHPANLSANEFEGFSIASNGLNVGDWVLSFYIQNSTDLPAGAEFAVNLNVTENTQTCCLTFFSTLYIATKTPITKNPQDIALLFDIGSNLGTPLAYTLSIIRMK